MKLYNEKFLINKNIPPIQFRIGINLGESYVLDTGKSEISSHALDLTCKIQELAKNNQILIGGPAEKLAHTQWRTKMNKIKTNSKFDYEIEVYEILNR